jgi:hypothetical protein
MSKTAKGGRSVGVIGLSLLALALALWLGPGASDNQVQANHGVAVRIDTDTSGNTALALGTIQACRTIGFGQIIDVDIVITGISDLASWEAYIKYDSSKLLISKPGDGSQGNNSRFLLQQAQPSPPGNQLQNTSEPLPDSSNPGIYRVGAADTSVIPGVTDPYPYTNPPQHGDGVLVRLQIQGNPGLGGFSSLQITQFQQGPGTVGPFLKDANATIVGDGNADGFTDNVFNGGLQVGTGTCADSDGDGVPTDSDNCPTVPNLDQANFDGDSQGDACDTDDDNDGLADTSEPATCTAPLPSHPGRLDPDCDDDLRSDGPSDPDGAGPILAGPDNCINVSNTSQTNTDGDSFGDACDLDDDNDGVNDTTDNCPLVANASQANYDLQWGDTQGGDACDPEDDGDGYSDAAEANVGTLNPDPCGNLVTIPGNAFPTSSAWPADLRSDTFSLNKVNISDLGTFTVPFRRINTSPGDPNYNVRWDLSPGTGGLGKRINVIDLSTMTTTYPLMFGGTTRAFGGPTCTP